MKKKRATQCGRWNLRCSIRLVVYATAVFSMLTGALLAFVRPDRPAKGSQRTLTFAERVAYQRAIEEVYWRHRIWPKERKEPKPSLDAVLSQTQIEKKVADYLRKSQALEDDWQRPITAEQLQAEINRMAQHTKQPEVLHELFEALGNDPFVVAECLTRPVLAERLVTNLYAREHEPFAAWPASAESQAPIRITPPSANYMLPKIWDGGCIDDTWTATSGTNAPDAREYHAAVWTGSEMIVWGGEGALPSFKATGGRYNPITDTWTPTSTSKRTKCPSWSHGRLDR